MSAPRAAAAGTSAATALHPPLEEVAEGVFRVEKILPSGWACNMLVVRLPGGGTLVHSPTWIDERTCDIVERVGVPEVLFAPNHFHHLGIGRFRARYPDAVVVAGTQAERRLARKGHAGLVDVATVSSRLVAGAHWLRCEGTRNGEVWLSLPGDAGPTWITCDAFFNVLRPITGVMGVLLRSLHTTPGLCIGQTFLWLGLRERATYRAWLLAALDEERPRRLLLSHGEVVTLDDASQPLRALIAARL